MLEENNLILHAHLQEARLLCALGWKMHHKWVRVVAFPLHCSQAALRLARLSLVTDKACAWDRQQDGSDLQTHW